MKESAHITRLRFTRCDLSWTRGKPWRDTRQLGWISASVFHIYAVYYGNQSTSDNVRTVHCQSVLVTCNLQCSVKNKIKINQSRFVLLSEHSSNFFLLAPVSFAVKQDAWTVCVLFTVVTTTEIHKLKSESGHHYEHSYPILKLTQQDWAMPLADNNLTQYFYGVPEKPCGWKETFFIFIYFFKKTWTFSLAVIKLTCSRITAKHSLAQKSSLAQH